MAWIPSYQELARHPKTKKLSRLLDVSLPATLGHLHLLWWWALDYTDDGQLSRYEPADIAEAMQWEGDPAVLLDALVASGFVDGDLHIHDWEFYTGGIVDKREKNRERQKRFRESRVTNALVTRDKCVSNGAREEKRREEKTTQEKRIEETSSPTAPTTPKEKPQPRFASDSDPAKLVTTLRGLIVGNNPTAKAAKMGACECQRWAEDFDKLIRLDGRDPPTIESVMRWAQNHHFWKLNILSPDKLRKQYDRLWLEMQQEVSPNGKARGSPGESDADPTYDRFKQFD